MTPLPEGGEEVLVGGSVLLVLCQVEWASHLNQLHAVIISNGQIHFLDLQLGMLLWIIYKNSVF